MCFGEKHRLADIETFCYEVTSCCTQGESEQDGQPVERFSFRCVDSVNGQRLLTRIPSRKRRKHRDCEDDSCRHQTDPEIVHRLSVISVPAR